MTVDDIMALAADYAAAAAGKTGATMSKRTEPTKPYVPGSLRTAIATALDEARAEIERLRAQHAEIMAVYDKALDNLTAERDALRAKLEVSEAASKAAVSKAEWQLVTNHELNALCLELSAIFNKHQQKAVNEARAEERERCAKVCEAELPADPFAHVSDWDAAQHLMAEHLAAAIRKGTT